MTTKRNADSDVITGEQLEGVAMRAVPKKESEGSTKSTRSGNMCLVWCDFGALCNIHEARASRVSRLFYPTQEDASGKDPTSAQHFSDSLQIFSDVP